LYAEGYMDATRSSEGTSAEWRVTSEWGTREGPRPLDNSEEKRVKIATKITTRRALILGQKGRPEACRATTKTPPQISEENALLGSLKSKKEEFTCGHHKRKGEKPKDGSACQRGGNLAEETDVSQPHSKRISRRCQHVKRRLRQRGGESSA